jgi:transposase-like protein
VLEQSYLIAEAAESLGITEKILYNWKKKFEDE